eukprot:TRINITY_DN12047_c0_g1_i1.p1 TRINITY_DN12047_c0_g1~~TRINITY_DN12047_c0_g1_i1.p1  ORF type:complete len:497 (+),score=65.63 TRINITY_DN12047_c0_g1_i1:15-1505(+)
MDGAVAHTRLRGIRRFNFEPPSYAVEINPDSNSNNNDANRVPNIIKRTRRVSHPTAAAGSRSFSSDSSQSLVFTFASIAVIVMVYTFIRLFQSGRFSFFGYRADSSSLTGTFVSRNNTCFNTIQGAKLVTDNSGAVCERSSLDVSNCCRNGLILDKLSCKTCRADLRCCSSFEYCVSCCLLHRKIQERVKAGGEDMSSTHGRLHPEQPLSPALSPSSSLSASAQQSQGADPYSSSPPYRNINSFRPYTTSSPSVSTPENHKNNQETREEQQSLASNNNHRLQRYPMSVNLNHENDEAEKRIGNEWTKTSRSENGALLARPKNYDHRASNAGSSWHQDEEESESEDELWWSEWVTFDECLRLCRTSSKSLKSGNKYRSTLKHCYDDGLDLLNSTLSNFRIIVASLGVSCTQACAGQSMLCHEDYLQKINDCDHLSQFFPCEAGCDHSQGVDQPAYVDISAAKGYRPGLCLVNSEPSYFDCDGSHEFTRRLCACVPRK